MVVPRSLPLLVGQLAALKIGAVYVPVDPGLPAQRRAFVIRDCEARLMLSDCSISTASKAMLCITYQTAVASVAREASDNLGLRVDPAPPAYVMYTSGSTGVPKGVVVPQHAVNRLVINNGYAQIENTDCLAHYSNPAFDASTFEVWGALLNGAKVAIVEQDAVLDARRFAHELQRAGVTAMYMSAGLFNQYADALTEVFARLRYLLVGGDVLEPGVIRRVLNGRRPQQLMNAYGPTECTTFTTTHLIEALPADASSVPIGRPIANAQVYVLSERQQPVPIGVTGELYIGGDGIACGYLNRPELTDARFIADPFSRDPRARLYRTGDLVRWRGDGVVEFLGRNDQQVKIRGFRVEIGEIEARLSEAEAVREAAVIALRDGSGEKMPGRLRRAARTR